MPLYDDIFVEQEPEGKPARRIPPQNPSPAPQYKIPQFNNEIYRNAPPQRDVPPLVDPTSGLILPENPGFPNLHSVPPQQDFSPVRSNLENTRESLQHERNAAQEKRENIHNPPAPPPGPQGFTAIDNNPEPRDHAVQPVDLVNVPLTEPTTLKPFIDGADEEIIAYVDAATGAPPSHAFGTPENPAGSHSVATLPPEVGYTDSPELFNEEPFLLDPFAYDRSLTVNRPDLLENQEPEEVALRIKRAEPGTRFTPEYRHVAPTIDGPMPHLYHGERYFPNR